MNKFLKSVHYLSMALLLLVLSMPLTSCGDDEEKGTDEPEVGTSIIGSWRSYPMLYTFDNDNRYTAVEKYDGGADDDIWSGSYSINGNLLIMTNDYYPDDVETYTIILLTAKKLILQDKYGIEEYTRVE